MRKNDISFTLIILAAASIVLALASIHFGFARLESWYINPFIWIGVGLLYAGNRAHKSEMQRAEEERAQIEAQMSDAMRKRLEAFRVGDK